MDLGSGLSRGRNLQTMSMLLEVRISTAKRNSEFCVALSRADIPCLKYTIAQVHFAVCLLERTRLSMTYRVPRYAVPSTIFDDPGAILRLMKLTGYVLGKVPTFKVIATALCLPTEQPFGPYWVFKDSIPWQLPGFAACVRQSVV